MIRCLVKECKHNYDGFCDESNWFAPTINYLDGWGVPPVCEDYELGEPPDDRFEIIAAYKKKLIESTNIESSPEEMALIDNILFRFWQLNWLPPIPHGRLIDAEALKASLVFAEKTADWAVPALRAVLMVIDEMPTIIPASEEGKIN